ncbi:MAG: plasmid pRiA4b ORF-3 family protein [Chroococcidiopsidaceae cyanobacterium CP_BM_RX_35]|nr:plasmid pRiA4b ORF-3 family protein [Chroococcidiopsidaceae cyanobacterium CP_BM_RX_35]
MPISTTFYKLHSCWTDCHLHQFIIHGKRYGIAQVGGVCFSDDPKQVKLSEFGFQVQEKFIYEYDFGDNWQHLIRAEAITPSKPNQFYPMCTAGKRAVPPEDCGGVWRFMELKQYYFVGYALELLSEIKVEGASAVKEQYEELQQLLKWLSLDRFDRRALDYRLQQYAERDQAWV